MDGYFENGRIYVDIEVYGFSPLNKTKFKAQIDTGFDGYLRIPIVESFPIGLILKGTKSYSLADKSTISNLVCFGTVVFFGDKEEIIPIDVPINGTVLIGAGLLKLIGKDLFIDYEREIVEFRDKPKENSIPKPPFKNPVKK